MPELPEVECLSRAVKQVLEGQTITHAKFYRKDLRGEIPIKDFNRLVVGHPIAKVHRRSKYMLWDTSEGVGVIHLGMTGNVIYRKTPEPEIPHTHAVFTVSDGEGDVTGYLHYVDPRRFGWISCCTHDEYPTHAFFRKLGPEPLSQNDLVDYLWVKSRKKTVAIKNFLMNAEVIVGVGNIYANEALFRAGVRPSRQTGRVTRREMESIVPCIQETLREAIQAGGTSFRDFKNADGEPGYFALKLNVYGRGGEPCPKCNSAIKTSRLGNRATYFCSVCQK